MSAPYFAVAIDHGTSFDAYLADAGSSLDRPSAKRRLTELASDADVDALVVEWRHRPEWALRWPADVWWGAPDQFFTEDMPAGHLARQLDLENLDEIWLTGVKLGINASGHAAWDRVCREIAFVSAAASGRGFEIVFEPYFADSDPPELRSRLLRRITSMSAVRFAKLNLGTHDLPAMYSRASKVPWLARSSNQPYQTYRHSLAHAVSEGCAGSMVGAALWRDLLVDLDGNADEFTRRVNDLRQIQAGQLTRLGPPTGPAPIAEGR